MIKNIRPGALASHRAGEIVLGGTLSGNTGHTLSQDYRAETRIIAWRVTRWLGVETVEVTNER